MKRCILPLTLAAVLVSSIVGGCVSQRIDVAPPCATLSAPSSLDPHTAFRGQGVLGGKYLLTAAHIFTQEGASFPPNQILLDGRAVGVSSPDHGDIETVRNLYGQKPPFRLQNCLEDWVLLELKDVSVPPSYQWSVGTGEVIYGETLYAVRWNDSQRRWQYVPLRVLIVDSDTTVPSALTFVSNPSRAKLDGWSGCFVGRFDFKSKRWTFVGILIAGNKKENGSVEHHLLLRPPAKALARLQTSLHSP